MSEELENIDAFEANASEGVKKVPNGTGVLVLGILSIVFCICTIVGIILSIIALVLHKKDKELYNSNPSVYEASFKNSRAGNICAIIGLALSSIMLIISIINMIVNGGNAYYY